MAESSCTTLILSIVNLSMCYSGAPLREQRKTLQNYKLYLKPANFSRYFFNFFSEAPRLSGPRRTVCALAGPPSQKRVQSYTFPPFPPNIFPKKFIKTMFSSIYLTSVCNYTPQKRLQTLPNHIGRHRTIAIFIGHLCTHFGRKNIGRRDADGRHIRLRKPIFFPHIRREHHQRRASDGLNDVARPTLIAEIYAAMRGQRHQ